VPRRDKPLKFFLDRSLGRIEVPNGLRDAGMELVTLSERYGIPEDQTIEDKTWLRDAGRRAEVVLMKDRKIRYRSAELAALKKYDVRAFCLTHGNLTGSEMVEHFTANMSQILTACRQAGPFLYIVHARTIELLPIDQFEEF
jgi:hypothetical protein